jgi:hypothetical protein
MCSPSFFFGPKYWTANRWPRPTLSKYLGGANETREYNKTHDEPTLWTNSMFGGMPVYLLQASYPNGPVALIDRVFKGLFFVGKNAHILFMLMLGNFVALLGFRVRPYVAAIGSALKYCLLAEGQADIYYRTSPNSEWDSAAGQAIIEHAGGRVLALVPGFPRFGYNKPSLINGGFICTGFAETAELTARLGS